jgi:hypothetical protein
MSSQIKIQRTTMLGTSLNGPYGSKCLISYTSGFVNFMGIVIFTYFLLGYYKNFNEEKKSDTKNTWIIGLYLLLITMFFNVTKCS